MRGRRTPSIRGLLKGLLGVVVVLAVLLSIVTLLQVRTATERSQAERQRVTSFRLSDGMRQSSNDLTRMVRLYVTTGDPRYRRYYDEILAIRSGDAPRPLDYDSSFWDRVLADGDAKVRRGPPAALTELMRRAHFSTDEFAALAASLRASNDLALLELQMMNKVAPRIAAGVDRDYLREVAPRYARLVDDNYHAQKRKIMEAIDRFTALVDARTARRAEDLQGSTDRLLAVQTAILVLLAAVLAAALVVAARSIVRPLSRLADVTRRITLGDWSQRAEPHGVAELTQLAGDFNEMADAIQNDLAGRRIAEREAREAENRLQTIADRVPGRGLSVPHRRRRRLQRPLHQPPRLDPPAGSQPGRRLPGDGARRAARGSRWLVGHHVERRPQRPPVGARVPHPHARRRGRVDAGPGADGQEP